MQRFSSASRFRLLPLGLLAALTAPAISAQAAAPPPEAFIIRYYRHVTPGDKTSSWQLLSAQDMARFVNRARCRCDEEIKIEIRLDTSKVTTLDPDYTEIQVGRFCDEGARWPNGTRWRPCLRLGTTNSPSQYFRNMVEFTVPVKWLASGVESTSDQDFNGDNVAIDSCPIAENAGGVWMCNGQQGCANGEFFISGDHSNNPTATTTSTNGATTMQSTAGVTFDLRSPTVQPTLTAAHGGDGAVSLNWEISENADIAGFRVLCRPLDGGTEIHAEAKKVFNTYPNQVARQTDATVFWPTQAFAGCVAANDDEGAVDQTNTDTTTSGDTSTTTDDSNSTSSATGSTETGSTARYYQDTTSTTTTDTTDTSTTTSDSGTDSADGNNEILRPDSVLADMDWNYVCSGHLTPTSKSARIGGLRNLVDYEFLVVSYDQAGNPRYSKNVLIGKPQQTLGFWEKCEDLDNACGEAGFCSVGKQSDTNWLGLLAIVGGLGVMTRRRRR